MHFHWDNFDNLLPRFAAQVALPIFNALVLLAIFGPALGKLADSFLSALPEFAGNAVPQLVDYFAQGLSLLGAVCPETDTGFCGLGGIAKQDGTLDPTLLSRLGDLLSGFVRATWLMFLNLLVGFTVLVIVLNYLTRMIALVAPFKLVVNNTQIMNRPGLAKAFDALPKSARDKAKLDLWLHARMILDAATDQVLYHSERNRLLRQIENLRTLMGYANVYLGLAVLRLFLPDTERYTNVAIIIAVCVLMVVCYFVFSAKSVELINNDLEAYRTLPRQEGNTLLQQLKRSSLTDADATASNGSGWDIAVGPTETLTYPEIARRVSRPKIVFVILFVLATGALVVSIALGWQP